MRFPNPEDPVQVARRINTFAACVRIAFSEPDSGCCLNLASTLGEFGVLIFGQGYQLAQEVAAYAATGSASVLCLRSR